MVVRQLRNLMREPIWIALMVIQPLIWLLLYGQLFSRVTALRGGASSYVEFLAPGIICMNAFFGGSWSGMAMISDLDRHVIDRFLAAPASRFAIVLSQRSFPDEVDINALRFVIVRCFLSAGVHAFPKWMGRTLWNNGNCELFRAAMIAAASEKAHGDH